MASNSSPSCPLKLCSYSVNGINSQSKRGQILYALHKSKVDIILIHKTYFRTDCIPRCSSIFYSKWFHSTMFSSKTRGVSIAIHKRLPLSLFEQVVDPNGRYLFLNFQLWNKRFTIANFYFSNHAQITAVSQYLQHLTDFAEGIIY